MILRLQSGRSEAQPLHRHLGDDKHKHKHDETLTLLVYRTRTPHTHALQIRMYIAKTKADTEIVRVKLRASDGNKHNIATSSSRHDTAENRTACNTPPPPLLLASPPTSPTQLLPHTNAYTVHSARRFGTFGLVPAQRPTPPSPQPRQPQPTHPRRLTTSI